MRQLTPAGQQAIDEIARRHGFGTEAVLAMLEAVVNGNGHMAQFYHPEFGGGGQWMSGGMTMVSDMFNSHLKGRVEGLCRELSQLIGSQPDLLQRGSFQSQSQGGGFAPSTGVASSSAEGNGDGSLFVSAAAQPDWWGPGLRWPDSTGGQNNMRYACFSQARRLAIDVGGEVTIYDTLDHRISGVSQQQGGGHSLRLGSQHGDVDVSQLPVVSVNGVAVQQPRPASATRGDAGDMRQADNFSPASSGQATGSAGGSDVFSTIERLAELHDRGILSQEEFATKKSELLARL